MTWTTPRTNWQPNEIVEAAEMNDIGANLAALKSPPSANVTLNENADYTTTSTSFVDVDANRLACTITTNGGDILVTFSGTVALSLIGGAVYFDVLVDGVRHAGDDGIMVMSSIGVNGSMNGSFSHWISGLSAGQHTFKLQWKVYSTVSATLWAGAGTPDVDMHPQFSAREVS